MFFNEVTSNVRSNCSSDVSVRTVCASYPFGSHMYRFGTETALGRHRWVSLTFQAREEPGALGGRVGEVWQKTTNTAGRYGRLGVQLSTKVVWGDPTCWENRHPILFCHFFPVIRVIVRALYKKITLFKSDISLPDIPEDQAPAS
ncbi:hypothetical protein BaRGS_00010580 [Batillaria attramentaria]|uniref:Uncharacterized protein n=1 Tax=Batillaria attramentaria TaxID=370345 RepID=A0ABD0LFU8_9CAEN